MRREDADDIEGQRVARGECRVEMPLVDGIEGAAEKLPFDDREVAREALR